MKVFQSLRRGIENGNYCLYIGGSFFVAILIVVTVADVTGRYLGHPIPNALEYRWNALACLVFLTLAHTQAQKGHISIALLKRYFPPRGRIILDVCLSLLGLFIMSFFVWGGAEYIVRSKSMGEVIEYTRIPIYPFKFTIFIGALGFCFQLIFDMLDHYRSLRKYSRGNST